jgi:ABC-type transporter Mla MlaB component
MELLRDAMGAHPMPWQLDWSGLERITPPALPLVEGLFASLCNEPVALRFSGCETLVKTLRVMMPSGDRTLPSESWMVLFSVLRATQMIDEFELAALDYCLTYELAPPAWEPARCEFERVDAAASLMAGALTLELTGDVLGDATRALTVPDAPQQRGERIVVNCSNLVRVDFSAAGSILNWVATRQADGYVVEFREVHRLAAAFFGVIGINEYARVITKSI